MSIDWIPARKITSKERGNHGFILTAKNPSGEVEYESCLERDFFLLGIHYPHMKKIQHQPITIKYKDEKGKDRKYTPDVYVEYNDGSKGLYEIKYEKDVRENQEKYELRWKAAEEWVKQRGIVFSLLMEREIRTPRRENVWFTLEASKCAFNDYYIYKLNNLIQPEGEEYNSLCNKLAEECGVEIGKTAQILCYSIYHGLVFVDTFSTKQLTRDTIIRARKKKDIAPFKPLWEDFGLSNGGNLSNAEIVQVIDETVESKSLGFKIPDKYKEKVDTREKIVIEWLQQPSSKRIPEWREDFCSKNGVKERTIFRWVKNYETNGIAGLIPGHQRAGRSKRLSEPILGLLEKTRIFYLRPEGTFKKAYQRLCELCGEYDLTTPSKSTFEWYVYQNTTEAEFGKKRGQKYYKSHYTPALASFQGSRIPMQVLQLDNF